MFVFFFLCSLFTTNATFIDNRFFPFFPQNYVRNYDKRSVLDSNFFMMFAHDSRLPEEKNGGLFEMYGKYNLIEIGNALEAIGQPNPIKPEWQTFDNLGIVFDFGGKINTQGIFYDAELAIWQCEKQSVSLGMRTAFMHISSCQTFDIGDSIINNLHLDAGGKIQLEQERREATRLLGINAEQWSTLGMTDVDLYIRLGKMTDYIYKCRFFDMAVYVGGLLPTGTLRDINNSASIPFSANGHAGIYVEGELNIEFREDWYVGGWVDFLHRFSKTQVLRLPYNSEQQLFGAIVGNFNVQPGFTFGGSLYFQVLDFNRGLGGKIQYTMIRHSSDDIKDLRANRRVVAIKNWQAIFDASEWSSEYITVEMLYDLNQTFNYENINPFVYVNFDAPINLFDAENIAKTFKLSVGIEISF